jgi:hypothetical protein
MNMVVVQGFTVACNRLEFCLSTCQPAPRGTAFDMSRDILLSGFAGKDNYKPWAQP